MTDSISYPVRLTIGLIIDGHDQRSSHSILDAAASYPRPNPTTKSDVPTKRRQAVIPMMLELKHTQLSDRLRNLELSDCIVDAYGPECRASIQSDRTDTKDGCDCPLGHLWPIFGILERLRNELKPNG
jgi:hypothetical protein